MAIRKDGIEFDTVEELLQYMGVIGVKAPVAPAPAPKAEKVAAPVEEPKKDVKRVIVMKGRKWSKEDEDLVIDYYNKYAKNKNIKRKILTKLAKILGRDNNAVSIKACYLKNEGKIKKQEKTVDTMIRSKPHVPMDYAEACIKKATYTQPQTKMPTMRLIDDRSQQILENTLKHMLNTGGELRYKDAIHLIQLKDGMDWDEYVWEAFCAEILHNKSEIEKVLGCKNKLEVALRQNHFVIVVKKG